MLLCRRRLLELRQKKAKDEALVYKKQGNKRQAIMALKRSKMLEGEVGKVDAQMFNLERQQLNLEGGSTTQNVVQAMGAGLRAQQQIARTMNPDTVADYYDQQQELIENQEEVQEILGQDADDAINDVDLLAELEALDAEEVENQAFTVPSNTVAVDTLPSVPSSAVTTLPSVPSKPVQANAGRKPIAVGSDEAAFMELEAELL